MTIGSRFPRGRERSRGRRPRGERRGGRREIAGKRSPRAKRAPKRSSRSPRGTLHRVKSRAKLIAHLSQQPTIGAAVAVARERSRLSRARLRARGSISTANITSRGSSREQFAVTNFLRQLYGSLETPLEAGESDVWKSRARSENQPFPLFVRFLSVEKSCADYKDLKLDQSSALFKGSSAREMRRTEFAIYGK